MADPNQPGRPGGALVVLHTDADATAGRLAIDVLPRLSALLTGKKSTGTKPLGKPLPKTEIGQPADRCTESETRHSWERSAVDRYSCIWRGRDVVIAWGDDALSASIEAAASPIDRLPHFVPTGMRQGRAPHNASA